MALMAGFPVAAQAETRCGFNYVLEGVLHDAGFPDNDAVLEVPRYIPE